jgi:Ser/Thr protein kinase RdoA (MazF antagonist)
MDTLGQEPRAFGLIHADLCLGEESNVLFHKGQARPIDFDDCGYGHWIYDLAVPLAHWQTAAQWATYRQALLGGYARVRPLSGPPGVGAHLAHLELFMAARHVSEILWGIDQAQHNAHFRQELDGWIEWSAAHVQLYLGKEAR